MRKLLFALLLLSPLAAVAQCPAGMAPVWACPDGLGDGSNSEVGIYYHGNVTLSGGSAILTETSATTRTVVGFSASADQPLGNGTTCTGSGNPGSYSCTGHWIGARIMFNTFNQQYGEFQINATLGQGWPAIWLLQNAGGTNNCQANYLAGGSGDISPNCNGLGSGSQEVDIAEGALITNSSSSTVDQNGYLTGFNGTSPNIILTNTSLGNLYTTPHTWAVVLTPTTLTFKIDGVTTGTRSANFNANYFLMIQAAAFGGSFGGNPASYTYPNNASVNWVKVCTAACANGITAAPAANGSVGFNGNGFDDFTGVTLTSITISPSTPVILGNGATQQYTAACVWSDSTTVCPTLTWASSNASAATINSSGLATGVALGSSTITASANSITSNPLTFQDIGGVKFTPFQGYGAAATGGTNIVHVTTTASTGAGSLATCAGTTGNYCVFDVGGTISAATATGIVANNNVTIDGFSAPTAITITGGDANGAALHINSKSNVIVQGIRFRSCGAAGNSRCIWAGDSGGSYGVPPTHTFNIVIDHNEFINATDELLDYAWLFNSTSSWNILTNTTGDSGCEAHLFGSFHITSHHNLYRSCLNGSGDTRIPMVAAGWSCCYNTPWPGSIHDIGMLGDVQDNVMSNNNPYAFYSPGDNQIRTWGNLVNNYFDDADLGPDHSRNMMQFAIRSDTLWYLAGNASTVNPVGAPSWYYQGPVDGPDNPVGVFCTTKTNAISCSQISNGGASCSATGVDPSCNAAALLATTSTPVTGPCVYDNTTGGRIQEWKNVIAQTGVVSKFADDATITALRNGVVQPTTSLFSSAWNTQAGSCSGATLVSITLTPASISIPSGNSQTLTAACLWSDTTTVCPTLSWASSVTSVATVNSSGLVAGIANGLTNITATANSITSNAVPISVTAPNAAQPPSIFAVLVSPK